MPKGKNINLGAAKQQWTAEYEAGMASEDTRRNRSGIGVKPIYDPDDWSSDKYMDDEGRRCVELKLKGTNQRKQVTVVATAVVVAPR